MELLVVLSLEATKKDALNAELSGLENADSENLAHSVLLHGTDSFLLTFRMAQPGGVFTTPRLHDGAGAKELTVSVVSSSVYAATLLAE